MAPLFTVWISSASIFSLEYGMLFPLEFFFQFLLLLYLIFGLSINFFPLETTQMNDLKNSSQHVFVLYKYPELFSVSPISSLCPSWDL